MFTASTFVVSAAILGGVGAFFATVIALAPKKLYVGGDARIDEVTGLLPGANCGACGKAGCRAFAETLVLGQVQPAGCTVASPEVRADIASYLGVDVGAATTRVARLLCSGGCDVAPQQADYQGLPTCRAAAAVAGGGKACPWGCLGLADCRDAKGVPEEVPEPRLLGNIFGTSNMVWALIIGLILIYLTAGYFLGGKWADNDPTPLAMYRILAWAAFTIALVPYVAVPVLSYAADAFEVLSVGIMAGSFIVVLILFIVPITLLGAVSPFAIRLSVDDAAKAGQVSGQIYAVSTLGSFIGTFLPTLIFIPTIGTRLTFMFFGMLLLTVALVGLARFASPREMLKPSRGSMRQSARL